MTDKKDEALKLALEALEHISSHYMSLPKIGCMALAAVEEALAEQPAHESAYQRGYMDGIAKGLRMEQPAQQKTEFVSPGGGYVPAIPRPLPLDWKLVPRTATPEMLKAMDECAQEGYDERLYEGMASSVYMAAWDASPTMGTLPEQPAQQQEPVAAGVIRTLVSIDKDGVETWKNEPFYTSPPASKPWVGLTPEQRASIAEANNMLVDDDFFDAIEAQLREKNA